MKSFFSKILAIIHKWAIPISLCCIAINTMDIKSRLDYIGDRLWRIDVDVNGVVEVKTEIQPHSSIEVKGKIDVSP